MQSCYLDSLASVPGGLGVAPLSTLSLVTRCKSACTCPAHRHIGPAAVQVTPAASALVFRVLQTLLDTWQRPARITGPVSEVSKLSFLKVYHCIPGHLT